MDIEVHCERARGPIRVGTLFAQQRRSSEALSFEYSAEWFAAKDRFALEPALPLSRGAFAPRPGLALFGCMSDSAPDTWGRRLMQRAERMRAKQARRTVRTLQETDYLLGVTDIARMGALRFRVVGPVDNEDAFQAPTQTGVPRLVDLSRLLQASERVLRDEATDIDLQLIFAPGSSLGGARPKASVLDAQGHLSIAKFPKDDDDYRIELWEAVALKLAAQAGIATPEHRLLRIRGKSVLLSRRFDREGTARISYLSAMTLLELKDGERASYPELADALAQHGARAATDLRELFKRMVLNVLISNVDDHLRNHGVLLSGNKGWVLAPVFDLNPTPVDVRARVLTTNISVSEGTCDLDLVLSVAEYFGLSLRAAKSSIKEVAASVASWRQTAKALGASTREVARMESAFEHDDALRAQAL